MQDQEPMQSENTIAKHLPEEVKKEDLAGKERARILNLFEITDNIQDLKSYIENNLDASQAALEIVKKSKTIRVKTEKKEDFPSSTITSSSLAQTTLSLAKKYGV